MPLPFEFSRYSLYWAAYLGIATAATALVATLIPALFQQRLHGRLRGLNEFLARQQLATLAYYSTILVTRAYLPDNSLVTLIIVGALGVSVALAAWGAKFASPARQDAILEKAHDQPCTPGDCNLSVFWKVRWHLLRGNLTLFATSLLIALLMPFCLVSPTPAHVPQAPLGPLDATISYQQEGFLPVHRVLLKLKAAGIITEQRLADELDARGVRLRTVPAPAPMPRASLRYEHARRTGRITRLYVCLPCPRSS